MIATFINSFILFFVTIDTIGNLPFFLNLTEGAKIKKKNQIALKSVIIAFFIMITFAYLGRYLLEAIQVSLDSLKIAGGVILMFLAIDILFEKRKIRREKRVEEALDEKSSKNLFIVNKKINGQLNLSADKIFSHRMLVDSFESRIKFVNGNILIEQLLLNLGKLGATDITGIIKNNKKFSNFKFENNIYVDNLKRFYNKFGIFNKQNISSNLFISGNFDLANLRLRLDEISNDKKFNDEDVAYFEREFNDLVLDDGYASLFNFLKLKEFVRLITTETN